MISDMRHPRALSFGILKETLSTERVVTDATDNGPPSLENPVKTLFSLLYQAEQRGAVILMG